MNFLSLYETYGIALALVTFVILYVYIHYKYIRHHALHKRFLAALWALMKNTIHGEHIRTLGYKEEQDQQKNSEAK
ncbi:hypothetical protein H2O73_16630 [Vibrio sp. 404]|uniref:Uncharacterized protein n=1 Tax=Vibrio marinisediminis TaxID=2758441 RepID=A0A7W2FTK8_9VIBR|nr:hypothetical protein [Vibrio marinisediminis]MBA5763992.1 hypothetical protein [Vibrio marinisediminis]